MVQKAYGNNSPLAFILEFSSQKQSLAVFGVYSRQNLNMYLTIFPLLALRQHMRHHCSTPCILFLRLVSYPALGCLALLGFFCQL